MGGQHEQAAGQGRRAPRESVGRQPERAGPSTGDQGGR
jgi:hypothetical protein